MKVYVKKEDKNSPVLGIIIAIIFLTISIGIFASAFINYESIIKLIESYGSLLLFAILFFGFGIYFVYLLIMPPKLYKMRLINKKFETYNGQNITYLEFTKAKEEEQEEDPSPDYKCYIIEDKNLIIGNCYLLGIKIFNWEPKYIKDINSINENELIENKNDNSKINITPVFLAVGFIFGGLLVLCILGSILYSQFAFIYLPIGVFCLIALFKIYKEIKK